MLETLRTLISLMAVDATIHQGGRSIIGTWSKIDAASPLKFLDSNGQEIKFIPGNIWIEVSVN